MKSSLDVATVGGSQRQTKQFIVIGLLVLLASSVITALLLDQLMAAGRQDEPVLVPPPPAVDPATIFSLLPPDSIIAIDDPQYATASEADEFLDSDELIIGVVINGDSRAYPLPIMSNHEIVNDIVGDHPVTITWCPLCYTALVFSRQIAGRDEPLTFGVSGKLLNETLVMFDRQTDSLWSQLYGSAVDGSLTGARLSFFPSTLTEWSAWREQYPDSLVLSKPLTCAQFNCGTYATNPRGSYDVDPYASYYVSSDEGVVNRSIPRDDARASGRPKERVLGLRLAGVEKAYPYRVLKNQPLINDVVNGEPVLVWFDAGKSTAVVYRRQVDGQTLAFDPAPEESAILIDRQTGSHWSAVSGEAIGGPLRGRRLPPLVATPAFLFGWFGYFPNSELYSGQ